LHTFVFAMYIDWNVADCSLLCCSSGGSHNKVLGYPSRHCRWYGARLLQQ